MQVLLVEDEHDLQQLYAEILRVDSHQVWQCDSAQAALNVLHEEDVDVVVLDIALPRHNGFAFLYELRSYSDWKDIPVILLSNLSPRELEVSQQLLMHLGVRQWLIKSKVHNAEIVQAVQAAGAAHESAS